MRRALALALALLALGVGCRNEMSSGPSTADFEAERARLAERIKKKAKRIAQPAAPAPVQPGEPGDGGFGRVSVDYVYDSAGKRDPFRSFFLLTARAGLASTEPQGPLEQFELGQIAVTALIWDATNPRALVMDPRGKSFIVREGSKIGKNAGRVIHIGDDLVLVKETYVDFAGEQTTKDVELRIRKSTGG